MSKDHPPSDNKATMDEGWLNWRQQYGLRAPQTAAEVQRQSTLDGMRQAIWLASMDSHIIRQCLELARYNGLCGEDTYVLLAYHALRQLEDHAQRSAELLRLMPVPPIVVRDRT